MINSQSSARANVTKGAGRPEQVSLIEVGRTRLRVAVRPGSGDYPPLLLISGIGVNFEVFNPFVAALDPDREIIRFDVPGVGGSPPSYLPLNFACLARLTARMLDQLGYKQVDVLGISWGGALAQQFALQYSARCRRLILVATSTGALMFPAHLTVLTKMLNPARYFRADYMRAIAPTIYGGRIRREPELIGKIFEQVHPPASLGYYGQMLGAAGWTSIHWLFWLRQPTLIIAGDDDPLIPLLNARLMAALIPNSTLQIVNDGHLFILTDAPKAAQMTQDFLKGHYA